MPIDTSERARRRALIEEHYAAENDHDLDRIMKTFADDGVMHYNHLPFKDDESIRDAHALLGMSAAPGALAGLCLTLDREHYTDEETVIEGRVCGRHQKEFFGYAPTDRDVELPFVAFYRFDDNDKLSSERVVMNLGPLHP